MRKPFQSIFLAFAIAMNGVAPAYATDYEGGPYFFRHKTNLVAIDSSEPETPEEQAKDISAAFVAGVNYVFEQRLPLKSEWADDNWSIVSGTLPDGIGFDTETKTFAGTPTTPGKGTRVELRGVDGLGREVATAEVVFDVYEMEGQAYFKTIYAHAGKYKFDQLPLPAGVVVEDWTVFGKVPSGVEIIGRNLDGTPTIAQAYSFFMQGLDYAGQPVASYAVNYLVEDGPTFPAVSSVVKPLGRDYRVTIADFGPPAIRNAIESHSLVKYYLEPAPGAVLPGTVDSNYDPLRLRVGGTVYAPYQTAKVRWTAKDVDGATGQSDWFEVGSSDPSPSCSSTPERLIWTAGTPVNTWLGIPPGAGGTLEYELTSGTLPAPVTLNRVTGYMTGTPTAATPQTSVTVTVHSTDGGKTVSFPCNYTVRTDFGSAKLVTTTPPQNQHVRIGDQFDGALKLEGGIGNFDWAVSDPATYPSFAFTGTTANASDVAISGIPTALGKNAVGVKVANGDGNVIAGAVSFRTYGPLAYKTQPQTFTVKRYDAAKAYGVVAHDPSTVIPDTSNATNQPSITLVPAPDQRLPEGIKFDVPLAPNGFYGSTMANVGTYGPFTVNLRDFSGDTKPSSPFSINVIERDPMVVDRLTPPVFYADLAGSMTRKPLTVLQPDGAKNLTITYALAGPDLPAGLSFNPETGEIVAGARLPFELIGAYGPFTVTATDTDGGNSSATFDVSVQDKAIPAFYPPYSQVKANIAGNPAANEVVTNIETRALRRLINTNTIYGTADEIVFLAPTPDLPRGLTFDYTDGVIKGSPTEEFDGTISIGFKDIKGRQGQANIPLLIKPYPRVRMSQASYDLPRLADASAYVDPPIKTIGFWNLKPTDWSLAVNEGSAQLPQGLSVNPATGAIEGHAEEVAGTSFPGIILKAVEITPSGRRLPTYTQPFTIDVKATLPLTFTYEIEEGDTLTWKLNGPTETTPYTLDTPPAVAYAAKVGGSYVAPLKYSIPLMPAGLSGIGVDSDGNLTGFPSAPGSWTVTVLVEDSATVNTARIRADIKIKATLGGYITATNAASQTSPGVRLRKGQQFQIPTDPNGIKVINAIGSPIFSTEPTILPEGLDFSGATGAFSETSNFADLPTGNGNDFDISVNARDSEGRTFKEPLVYRFNVFDRVQLSMPASYGAQQFDVINIAFPAIENQIGDRATYTLTGDLPGTRVDAVYDATGTAFTHFAYEETDGTPVTTSDADSLPADAIVFDPIARTLKGTPSNSGTFPLTLTAADSNRHAALYTAPTRSSYEQATAEFQIAVNPALPLAVSSLDDSYNAKAFSPSNALSVAWNPAENAVGKVTYSLVGDVPGTLAVKQYDPQGAFTGYSVDGTTVTDPAMLPLDALVFDGQARTLTGVPSEAGTFTFAIRATDSVVWAHNTATTTDITVTVEAAAPLVANTKVGADVVSTETVARYTTAPTLTTTVENAAYGKKLTWTKVSGDLPQGITPVAGDFSVSYTGYAEVLGASDPIVWRATDAAGRSVLVGPITMNIVERPALVLATPANPVPLVAHTTDASVTVSASNSAFGLPIGVANWAVTGTLPPGITAEITDSKVVFTGIPTQTGVFENVVVSATDSLGGTAGNASLTIAFAVAERPALSLSSTANPVRLVSHVTDANVAVTAANAAYGLPIGVANWAVTGTLPPGITAEITDGAVTFTGRATQVGTYGDVVVSATDSVGGTAGNVSLPIVFEVEERPALALSSSINPVGLVVNSTETDVVVTAANAAYDLPIGADGWTVSDTLPPGVTAEISDSAVTFHGVATATGLYEVVVRATDSVGGTAGTAELTVPFRVLIPEDQITLEAATINAKPGLAFDFTPTHGNTYGKVLFTSPEIAGAYASSMDLEASTGKISGSFSTVGDRSFNLQVSDTTKRLTSRPFTVRVLPVIRAVVPTQVQATQGQTLLVQTDTFNVAGVASYEKGTGDWPEELKVDASDGSIYFESVDPITGVKSGKVSLATGSYGGLTIRAIDTLANGLRDAQLSNTFSLVVNPVNDNPNIADVAAGKSLLFTVGTAMQWRPTVTEQVGGGVWNYAGTKYAINKDLKADTGLDFDVDTGIISGTATKAVIYTDMTIRVTSARGDVDITAPFWFGVRPSEPLAFVSGHPSQYTVHTGVLKSGIPVAIENTYGSVTFSVPDSNFTKGVIDTVNQTMSVTVPTTSTTSYQTVRATDLFGRTVDKRIDFTSVPLDITVSLSGPIAGDQYTGSVTALNLFGTATYKFVGLPTGLTFDQSTGIVSGVTTAVGTFNVTVTATDSFDGAKATKVVSLVSSMPVFRYWKVGWTNVSTLTAVYGSELKFYNPDRTTDFIQAAKSAGKLTVTATKGYVLDLPKLYDGVLQALSVKFCKTSACNTSVAGTRFELLFDFGTYQVISPKSFFFDEYINQAVTGNSLAVYDARVNGAGVSIEGSKDGVNWVTVPNTSTNCDPSGGQCSAFGSTARGRSSFILD